MTETHAFAVGDKVAVTSHYVWCGRDTFGWPGEVVEVWDREDDPPLHEVAVEGRGAIPYFADELTRATAPEVAVVSAAELLVPGLGPAGLPPIEPRPRCRFGRPHVWIDYEVDGRAVGQCGKCGSMSSNYESGAS